VKLNRVQNIIGAITDFFTVMKNKSVIQIWNNIRMSLIYGKKHILGRTVPLIQYF